jgi:2-phospho-L-lactate guanylyltransferase
VTWDVIVPLKGLDSAKSRLSGLGAGLRTKLAEAMALDTVAAVAGCPRHVRVHVVCDDDQLGAAVLRLGAGVVLHRGAPPGLNAALTHVAERLGGTSPVAALLGDLPALLGEDLAEVLDRATGVPRSTVADRAGTGCTFLAATAGQRLAPDFGPWSFARHVAGGATPLPAAPGVRQDVDVPADLAAVARLGPGPRTSRLLSGVHGHGLLRLLDATATA